MSSIEEILRDFRLAAMEKGEEGGLRDHELYETLRSSFHALMTFGEPGRAAFASLLSDPGNSVRGWVAAQLLSEGNEEALETLRELAAKKGMDGFNARIALEEYEAGRLSSPFPATAP